MPTPTISAETTIPPAVVPCQTRAGMPLTLTRLVVLSIVIFTGLAGVYAANGTFGPRRAAIAGVLQLGAASEPMTLRAAAAKVQDAIDYAELAAQAAPAGHAIFQALEDAREAKEWIDDQIPWFAGDGPALPTVSATVSRVVDAVYDAAATLRTYADVPTAYDTHPPFPIWPLLAAGAAAIAGFYWFVHRPRSRGFR